MKVLFIGSKSAEALSQWLVGIGEEVQYFEQNISIDQVISMKPSIIICYNYKYVITREILEYVGWNAVNLHISFLPWNKGAYPNIFSFLEETPKGVTIHYMDEKVDTGPILLQKKVYINEEQETLNSSYLILHDELQKLFKENWLSIKSKTLLPTPQKEAGTTHYKKDFMLFKDLIAEKGWDTPLGELRENCRVRGQ